VGQIERVVPFLLLVVLILGAPSLFEEAEGAPALLENEYSLILSQAQSFLENRKRSEALTILHRALKQTKRRDQRKELLSFLHKAEEVFFTEQGQQAFEFANTLRFEQKDRSVEKYLEAQKYEGPNVLVLVALARVQMQKGDCDGALATLESYKSDPSHTVRLVMTKMYALACSGDLRVVFDYLKTVPSETLPAEILKSYEAVGALQKGQQKMQASQKSVNSHFQPLLWQYEIKYSKPPSKSVTVYDSYLDFCRKHRREVLEDEYYDPRLCADIDVVEGQRNTLVNEVNKGKNLQ
jgi:hypothetical protein